jgi:hypothetical protein
MTPPRRRFMRPWKVIEHDGSYEIKDATGLPLASVYFENETIRQSSKDEARRLAAQSRGCRQDDDPPGDVGQKRRRGNLAKCWMPE